MKYTTGAKPSIKDHRTVKHTSFAVSPLITGGIHYVKEDILDQHYVGICTAISRVQLRQKQTGRKYSDAFQYLCQKKYVDGNWDEGSSPLSSNKVAKNIGFLPYEFWTATTESDKLLPYPQYIAKLKAVPDAEVERLKALCIDPIAGYAQGDHTTAQGVAKAIYDSPGQCGILCRYGCTSNWWTPVIEPLRNAPETSGHQVINSWFDYSSGKSMQEIPNTWGPDWVRDGKCFINWDNYPMTECWVDLQFTPEIPPYKFTKSMGYGSRLAPDVKQLQRRLGVIETGFFGWLTFAAVVKYQKANGIEAIGYVGPKTRLSLNKT